MQEQLTGEMQKAAATQDYDRAAQLRDLLADLRDTTKKVSRFERVPYSLPLALDSEKDLAELATVLGLGAPPQRIDGIDISNISGTFKVASLVSFRNGRPDRANYRRFKIKTVEGQDDFASVAEVVRRRYARVLKESKVQSQKSKAREDVTGGERPGVSQDPAPSEAAASSPATEPASRFTSHVSRVTHHASRITPPPPSLPDLLLIDGGKGQLGAAR